MKNNLTILSFKSYNKTILFLSFLFFLFSCKKDTDENRNPSTLTNVTVENNPGETVISYSLPKQQDIILVSVVLPNEDGSLDIRRYKLPEHMSSLTLKELRPSKKVIQLYTVNGAGLESERVDVEIDPKISLSELYLNNVLETVEFEPILGAMKLKFDSNSDHLNLSFQLSFEDSKGDWILFSEVLSSEKSGELIIQDFVYSKFGMFIENELEERSEYLLAEVNPVQEYELDKAKWKAAKLPSDNWETRAPEVNLFIENIWDGDISPDAVRFESVPKPFPHWFTIDLGENQPLKLTKIKVHQHANWRVNTYTKYHPKVFEIWGSNNPNPDGSWDGWDKIIDCHSYQPSQSPFGTVTVADHEYMLQGEEFRFPTDTDSYRYIRFKTLQTWDSNALEAYIRLQEITLWGY